MSDRSERRIRRREQRRRRRAFRRALLRSPWMDISPEAPLYAIFISWMAFRLWGRKPAPKHGPAVQADDED